RDRVWMTSGPPKRSMAAAFIVSGMDGFTVDFPPARTPRDRIWTCIGDRPVGASGIATDKTHEADGRGPCRISGASAVTPFKNPEHVADSVRQSRGVRAVPRPPVEET